MAIYWAVQSPIPGSSWSFSVTAFRVETGFEVDLSRGDGPGDGPNARGSRRGDPQGGQVGFVHGRQSFRRGAQAGQARDRRIDRLAKAVRQPAGKSRRRPHGNALAEDRANRQLEPVERAGHPQSRAASDDAREPRIDGEVSGNHVRPRAQVEKVFQADEDLRQGRHERRRQLDRKCVSSGNRPDTEPSLMTADGGRPAVSLIVDRFDARRRPSREESQQDCPGQGRTISQREPDAIAGTARWSTCAASATA